MINPTRRQFLGLTVSSLALMAGGAVFGAPSHPSAADKGREHLILCDTDEEIDPDNNDVVRVTNPGSVKWLDVAAQKTNKIDLPFYGHTAIQNPAHPHQAVTFEKWGRRGAMIDIREESVIASTEAADNNVFFGHAAFSADGQFLLVTEESYERDNGQLLLRNAADFDILKSLSTAGRRPHDCQLLKDNKTILVANEGHREFKPSLAWIEWESEKLLHKIEFNPWVPGHFKSPRFGGFSHFAVSHDNWICCGGVSREIVDGKIGSRYAIIGFVSPKGHVYYPDLPIELTSQMKGEALSIAMLGNSGLVAITISLGGMCLVFDYKTQRLLTNITAPNCRGVAPSLHHTNGHHSVLLSSKQGLTTAEFSINSDVHSSLLSRDFFGGGAHITRTYI